MKVSGSYASLLRGVSQQPPEVRMAGQHTEQVNMIADPIAGLSRRRGTTFVKSSSVGALSLAAFADANGYRTLEHTARSKDYMILWRTVGSAALVSASLPPVICFNRTDSVFVPISYEAANAVRDLLHASGASAVVSLGEYIVFAANGTACVTTGTQRWGEAAYSKALIWIRGGAYNRTFNVTSGTTTFSYTTPDAAAAGSALAISPGAIATSLAAAGTAAGVTTSVFGSHVYCSSIAAEIAVSDGGDGSLIRGVYGTVDEVSKLTLYGVHGQIVKVQTGPDTAYYVQANNKNPATVVGETIWQECAGVQQAAVPTYNVGMATVRSGTLYVGMTSATSANGLPHLPVVAGYSAPPTIVPALAGDALLNPMPRWMNNQITYMGLFQDRLLVASGAALAVSAAGDYLSFFRSSVVTVPLKDPFEMIAQGGEDDTLRHSVAYNKNFVIFGDKRQYIINGQTALTPASPNMSIMTVYPDAANCPPVAAGGQIYYARSREGNVAVHQIQPGAYVDSAESFPASSQIGNYIPADAGEMVAIPGAPALLVIRSRSTPHVVYVFSYLDMPDGRKQDAWFRWEFDAKLGSILGVSNTPQGLLFIFARMVGSTMYLVADLLPLSTVGSPMPYLDSARPYASVIAGTNEVTTSEAGWSAAYDNTTVRFLIGGDFSEAAGYAAQYPEGYTGMWGGVSFDSYVTLTNPYGRDPKGVAILTGRTVITKLSVNSKNSSGLVADVVAGGVVTTTNFNGRLVGDILNTIGVVPISSSIMTVAVGRETREYVATLKARKWFPLNIIGIEWTGQSFNRTPRA